MNLFPLLTDISNKTFLIIGGGDVAKEKFISLRRFDERIIILSNRISFYDIIKDDEKVQFLEKDFSPDDITALKPDFVIGATNDREIDKIIKDACDREGIPVNIADDPKLCTFFMPGMIKNGDLTVSLSSNGKSPLFVRRLREKIETVVPKNSSEILNIMGDLRKTVKTRIKEQNKRKEFYNELLNIFLDDDKALFNDDIIDDLLKKYEG